MKSADGGPARRRLNLSMAARWILIIFHEFLLSFVETGLRNVGGYQAYQDEHKFEWYVLGELTGLYNVNVSGSMLMC